MVRSDLSVGQGSRVNMMMVVLSLVLMVVCFGLAEWFTPRRVLADELPAMNLAKSVPESFGGWRWTRLLCRCCPIQLSRSNWMPCIQKR